MALRPLAFLTGLMWGSIYEECPQAEYTGIAMEYGTLPMMETLQALRAEGWLHLHPEAQPALADQIRQQVRDAFLHRHRRVEGAGGGAGARSAVPGRGRTGRAAQGLKR
jgi:hypothetical protein